MAFRTTVLEKVMWSLGSRLNCKRWNHIALPAPLERTIDTTTQTRFGLPGFDGESRNGVEIGIPKFSFGGSMELMAVPKKKVSRYKRGLRNGPKALKPVPVIIRCKSCGRVKLPHFYCCSGDRGMSGERSEATS